MFNKIIQSLNYSSSGMVDQNLDCANLRWFILTNQILASLNGKDVLHFYRIRPIRLFLLFKGESRHMKPA